MREALNLGEGSPTSTLQTGGFPGQTQINGTGIAGGGQVGYNLIFGRRWFAGLEADFGTLRIHIHDGREPGCTLRT